MQASRRERAIGAGLVAAAYLLALVQRPGTVVADTKVDLYVDPAGFLADVASAWTPTGQLGHVFGGQYGGYLFPMAPWFAGGDAAGLPVWLVHRLWLGTLFALSAYGMVRLLDALWPEKRRGPVHVAAAVLYVLNPYVAVYANRTSVALLAYAALPWLLLAIHRGLRDPKGWRWPALFALALTCTGGGVNAATTGWILLGPALFLLYERYAAGGVAKGAIRPFLVRLAPVTILANVWWVLPLLVHARFGVGFLPFTEQPGTIWQTTSITESLRLAGFWTSYIGVGYGGELRPFASHGPVLLFHWPVVLAGLAVPGLTLLGFAWTRRWRYGPFFALLALSGLLVMVAGFPEGTPLRRALTFTYNHVEAVQFLRTTYKAGPLLALGLAALGGAAFAAAWAKARWIAGIPAALLVALAAWPLTTGTAPEKQLAFDVPGYWEETADAVDRLPRNERALVLPGQLFAYYDWGGTIDPILPSLTERPVAQRTLVPYADLRAIDLHWAVDDLVSQERALPGQLVPLVDLMGAGAVVTQADGDRTRSGEPGPVEASEALGVGLPQGWAAYMDEPVMGLKDLGPKELESAASGRIAPPQRLPRVRVAQASTGGIVRLLPRRGMTVVDGGAQGVTALAGFGALDPDRPLAYAADLDAKAINGASSVVVTDTNRRQAFVSSRLRGNRGFLLTPRQEVSEDGALLDPFAAGPDAQTVARYAGVKRIEAPFSPQITQFPEHRPFAALDGDDKTAWLADRALARSRHYLEVELDRPRRIGHVDVTPYSDRFGRTRRIAVNGRAVAVRPGTNRVEVPGEVDRVRVAILDVTQPGDRSGGAGGISELRIPGVELRESLRPPVLAERALTPTYPGALTYLLSRQTVDAPGHEGGGPVGPFQSYRLRDRVDPEPQLSRTIDPPVSREWNVDAWVRPNARGEPVLDRLTKTTGTVTATSSGLFENLARHRASKAFDGNPRTAWIGAWEGRASVRFTLDRTTTLRRLRLVAPDAVVRRPTLVRIGGQTVGVTAEGAVELQRPIRGREFVLEVLEARFLTGTPDRLRQRRAVGIADIGGVPGARIANSGGRLDGRCGDARVRTTGGIVDLRPVGEVADVEQGRALAAVTCDGPTRLATGEQQVTGLPGPLTVDHLRLESPSAGITEIDEILTPPMSAPDDESIARAIEEIQRRVREAERRGEPMPRTDELEPEIDDGPGGGGEGSGRDPVPQLGEATPEIDSTTPGRPAPTAHGRVVDGGDPGRGKRDGVRLEVDQPSYLVLGESYNEGWRATCDGEDLGRPRPMQGYANGWPVPTGCTKASFAFAPNRLLPPAYVVSLIVCLLLIVVLARRPRHPIPATAAQHPIHDAKPTRWSLRKALAAGVVAALLLGFVFAIRAGIVMGPAVAFILWRGIGAKQLALAGGALLLTVVPILYLAVPVDDPGGYNTNLAVERIAAHWVGVAAIFLLGAALARQLRGARRASGYGPPGASA